MDQNAIIQIREIIKESGAFEQLLCTERANRLFNMCALTAVVILCILAARRFWRWQFQFEGADTERVALKFFTTFLVIVFLLLWIKSLLGVYQIYTNPVAEVLKSLLAHK